jgi:hypothetical protein
MYHTDTYVSLSISVPKSMRKEIHERALSLRMTRTDYIKALIVADLSQGPNAPFTYTQTPLPREQIAGVLSKEKAPAAKRRRRPEPVAVS